MGQTGGLMPDCYIDPAAHGKQAVSVICLFETASAVLSILQFGDKKN